MPATSWFYVIYVVRHIAILCLSMVSYVVCVIYSVMTIRLIWLLWLRPGFPNTVPLDIVFLSVIIWYRICNNTHYMQNMSSNDGVCMGIIGYTVLADTIPKEI